MDSIAMKGFEAVRDTPRKTVLNFWVDLVTTVLFAALLGSGALMKWILPPGTCDDDALKLWLGHARHWWGDIHFWIAMAMLALLVLHVYLHWAWVVNLWGRMVGKVSAPQTWAVVILIGGLMAVPFIIPAEVIAVETLTGQTENAAEGAGEESPGVAPCGIEGLSCSDCPAADDRLFGSGCSDDEVASPIAEDAVQEESDCADDPNACLECPSAGNCDSAPSVDEGTEE